MYLNLSDPLSIVHLTLSDSKVSYINAAIVEGFKKINKYIITHNKVNVIVSLNEINLQDDVSMKSEHNLSNLKNFLVFSTILA